ncbi:MAG: ChrR family anti-sigma-E factor [Pseudomonadota bacterium]
MMMSQSPFHCPTDARLLDYAAGAASEPVALLIATHLAFCPRCRSEVDRLESIGGALLDEITPEAMSADCLDRVLARIERPQSPISDTKPSPSLGINTDIPEPLRNYIDRPLAELPWRRRGPISEIELLPEVEGHSTRLLWIRAGAAAPRHTHVGSELTLVLKGSFRDGHGHYRCGDVEEADADLDHRPIAGDEEDCLCLAVTDAPLKLTSPLGRLLNPFVKI